MDHVGADAGAPAPRAETLPIRLRTSLPGCSIPYVPYMVPVAWRRSQLSTLVNKVLSTAGEHRTVPFDFIVDGELLRTSLGEYFARKGLSPESTLELEYVRSTLPPVFRDAAVHDDWIAAVDAQCAGYVLTASFDGCLRVHRAEKGALGVEPLTLEPVHGGRGRPSLSAARWLEQGEQGAGALVTGTMDGVVSVWHAPACEPRTVPAIDALDAPFHTAPVSTLDVRRGEQPSVLSASWDGSLALWDPPAAPQSSDSGAKRRRGTPAERRDGAEPEAPEPKLMLHHVAPAMGAAAARMLGAPPAPGTNARALGVFAPEDASCVWSAGWDGTVKAWDVNAGGIATGQKSSDRVHLCLDAFHGAARTQLVTGHMDHSLALYDFRDQVNTAVAIANAHAAPVGVVRAHPLSPQLFVSGAYDGRLKVWDVRSPRQALFALTQPSAATESGQARADKVLALDWTADGECVLAGGADCRVSLYEGHGIGREQI